MKILNLHPFYSLSFFNFEFSLELFLRQLIKNINLVLFFKLQQPKLPRRSLQYFTNVLHFFDKYLFII